MYLFLKNKFFIIFVLLCVTSCYYKRDPSLPYNNKFLKKYGKKIERAKNRHKNIVKQNDIFYDEKLNRIANLKNDDTNLKRKEINKEFLNSYANNYENVTKKEVVYLSKNYENFTNNKKQEIKQDKFVYFNKEYLKNKPYNSINYSTLQVNYDYVLLIKEIQYQEYLQHFMEQEKARQIAQEAKENAIKQEKEKSSFNILNRFRNLLRKDE